MNGTLFTMCSFKHYDACAWALVHPAKSNDKLNGRMRVCVCVLTRVLAHTENVYSLRKRHCPTHHILSVWLFFILVFMYLPIHTTVGLLNVHNVTETPSTECPTYYMARSFLFNFADKFH